MLSQEAREVLMTDISNTLEDFALMRALYQAYQWRLALILEESPKSIFGTSDAGYGRSGRSVVVPEILKQYPSLQGILIDRGAALEDAKASSLELSILSRTERER